MSLHTIEGKKEFKLQDQSTAIIAGIIIGFGLTVGTSIAAALLFYLLKIIFS